jgi:hypothetical protein
MARSGDRFDGCDYLCYQCYQRLYGRCGYANAPSVSMSYKRPVRTVLGIALIFMSVKTLKWTINVVLTGETQWLSYVPLLIFFAVCLCFPCDMIHRLALPRC